MSAPSPHINEVRTWVPMGDAELETDFPSVMIVVQREGVRWGAKRVAPVQAIYICRLIP